jgi:hypothetical protein
MWKNNSHRNSASKKWMLSEMWFSNQIAFVFRLEPFTFHQFAAKTFLCSIPPPSGKISIRRANCFSSPGRA